MSVPTTVSTNRPIWFHYSAPVIIVTQTIDLFRILCAIFTLLNGIGNANSIFFRLFITMSSHLLVRAVI